MHGERGEVRIGFWLRDQMEGNHVVDLAVDGKSYPTVNFVFISVRLRFKEFSFCLVFKGFIC